MQKDKYILQKYYANCVFLLQLFSHVSYKGGTGNTNIIGALKIRNNI